MKHFLFAFLLIPAVSFCQKTVVLEQRDVPKPTTVDSAVKRWNESQAEFNKLNIQAKDFYYWTNYSRINPKRFWDSVVVPVLQTFPTLKSSYTESLKSDLYNAARLPLLQLNHNLIFTAQGHALDIGQKKGTPGHISSDGRTFVDRIKAVGIRDCGGENVSLGNVDPILSLVFLYIDNGIPELGHRKALLNSNYVETGIGVSQYGDTDNIFIVQDFSCNQQNVPRGTN